MFRFLLLSLVALLWPLCVASQSNPWGLLSSSPVAPDRWDAMSFATRDSGWIAGTISGVFRTVDGGQSWQELSSAYGETEPGYFRSIGFGSSVVGWLGSVGSSRQFLMTRDGGNTWTEAQGYDSAIAKGFCGIHAPNSNTVFAVGPYTRQIAGLPHVTFSYDQGATYTTTTMDSLVDGLVDVLCIDSSRIIAGGSLGTSIFADSRACIILSTDSGRSWRRSFLDTIRGTQVWKLQRLADGTLIGTVQMYASTAIRHIRSADNGTTWTVVHGTTHDMPNRYILQTIFFLDTKTGFAGGRQLPLHVTHDGGVTWKLLDTTVTNLNKFSFVDDTTVFASGTAVWKLGHSVPTHVRALGSQPSISARLLPGRQIAIHMDERIPVRHLALYDVQGKLLAEQPLAIHTGTQNDIVVPVPHGHRGTLIVNVWSTIDHFASIISVP
jgi:photosystem II stability/assembly factor-like uncharacterized protein